ncbi:MAG: hypothetical protein AABY49_02620 [Planctomycetota bacterium]
MVVIYADSGNPQSKTEGFLSILAGGGEEAAPDCENKGGIIIKNHLIEVVRQKLSLVSIVKLAA